MKGKKTIRVYDKRVGYTLEVSRKVTILRGDSGTGKTTFKNMIDKYSCYGSTSGVSLECEVPVHCVTLHEYMPVSCLKQIEGSIVIIDAADINIMKSNQFYEVIDALDIYVVIISRRGTLGRVSYLADEVFELKCM